jgi:hypothetical protein
MSPMSDRNTSVRFLIAAAVAAGTIQAVLARHFLLDDALIHVRYAELLLQAGFPTSDGVSRSFGDSSPAFLGLTALGLWLGGSYFVTKLLSLAGFAALMVLLAGAAWREQRSDLQAVLIAGLLLVVSPFGVKWLSDGMETSLAVVLAVLLAGTLARDRGVGLIAALCVLVRVELVALVAVAACGQWMQSRRWAAAMTALGGLAALGIVYFAFGAFWSDAAVAKIRHAYSPTEFIVLLASLLGGAGLLGVGLVVGWLLLCWSAMRRISVEGLPLLAGLVSLPAALLVIFVTGQAVEGIRPLLPFFAFSLACGMCLLRRRAPSPLQRWYLVPAAVLGVVLAVADGVAVEQIVSTQSRSLQAMQQQDWSGLRGHTGVAWDVGYLAYFTRTPICDVQGLINGPGFARQSIVSRLRYCAETAEFAFVDQPRFLILATALDMSDWRICGRFDFAHRKAPVAAYLLVAPGLAQSPLCPATAPQIGSGSRVSLESVAGGKG